MSGTANDPIVPDSSTEFGDQWDSDDGVPIADDPLPRVRIRLSKCYFERDDLCLPACLSQYISARVMTVKFTVSITEYWAKCYPQGYSWRIRNGRLSFLRQTNFHMGDKIDLVMACRSSSMVHFCVINDDPMWVEIERSFPTPILFESP